jgi:hypothetical protein
MNRQETVYVIMRKLGRTDKPVKAIDDRADARAYAKHMNTRVGKAKYRAMPVKKG